MLRVGGGKNEGTRFLTFVDAMIGFKHLLTQEDLDKAASMCQGLKGHLKSQFLVLSDDRLPPPPPSKKRPFSKVDGEENPNVKRFGEISSSGPEQVTAQIHGQFQYQVPHGSSQAQAMMSVSGPEQVTAQIHCQPQYQLQSLPSQSQAHSLMNGVQQVLQYPSQQMLTSGQPLFSPSSFPPLPGVQQIPVAQDLSTVPTVQPGKIVVGGGGYQTVQGRNSRRQRSIAPDRTKSKKVLDKAQGH